MSLILFLIFQKINEMIFVVFFVCLVVNSGATLAFLSSATCTCTGRISINVGMIGGRGWTNDGYLSGLCGDEDDRNKAQEDYKEFSDRRAAFLSRQSEIMKTPKGQEFLKQQQQQEQRMQQIFDDESELNVDDYETSGGGTRFGRLMMKKGKVRNNGRLGGINHQRLDPLHDDDDDDDEKG